MSLTLTADFLAQTGISIAKSYWPHISVEKLQQQWAFETLRKFKVSMEVIGQISHQKPMLYLGNHVSYFDIVLLMATVPSISFVAKKELSRWPLFGHAARATKTIFVQRESTNSRKKARRAIEEGLERKQRIVLFPSGTTCLNEKKPWRRGAFEIAQQNNVMVQPFRLTYNPLRSLAYIDDDFFPTHLYQLTRLPSIQAKIEFHPPVSIENAERDCEKWWAWTRDSDFHC
jgi:lyso-ornithine lipid O-acyltransferase